MKFWRTGPLFPLNKWDYLLIGCFLGALVISVAVMWMYRANQSTYTLTLPQEPPKTDGQILVNDGSGQLKWMKEPRVYGIHVDAGPSESGTVTEQYGFDCGEPIRYNDLGGTPQELPCTTLHVGSH